MSRIWRGLPMPEVRNFRHRVCSWPTMFSNNSAGPPRERLARVIAPISWSQSTETVIRRNWSAASSVASQLRRSGPASPTAGWVALVVSGRLVPVLNLFSSPDLGLVLAGGLIVRPGHWPQRPTRPAVDWRRPVVGFQELSFVGHGDWVLIVLPAVDQGVLDPELIDDAADHVVRHLLNRGGPRVIGHRRREDHRTRARQIVHVLQVDLAQGSLPCDQNEPAAFLQRDVGGAGDQVVAEADPDGAQRLHAARADDHAIRAERPTGNACGKITGTVSVRSQRPDLLDAVVCLELDRRPCPVAENQMRLDPQLPKNFQQTDAQSGAGSSGHGDHQTHRLLLRQFGCDAVELATARSPAPNRAIQPAIRRQCLAPLCDARDPQEPAPRR